MSVEISKDTQTIFAMFGLRVGFRTKEYIEIEFNRSPDIHRVIAATGELLKTFKKGGFQCTAEVVERQSFTTVLPQPNKRYAEPGRHIMLAKIRALGRHITNAKASSTIMDTSYAMRFIPPASFGVRPDFERMVRYIVKELQSEAVT